jgi:isoleucyl-tRNA synthetase
MAPITPFLTEAMYQRLVRGVEPGAPESVHLHPWPTVDPSLVDEDLMAKMDMAVRVSSLGRAARSKSGIKLRQPLQEAVVVGEETTLAQLGDLSALVKEELNVKEVRLTQDRGELQRYVVRPVRRLLGEKHGRDLPKVVNALQGLGKGEATLLLNGESVMVEVGDAHVEVLPEEVEVESVPTEEYSVMEAPELLVGVTTEITEELKREGLARDVVRRIQALRKEADFEIDDLIETHYMGGPEVVEVFETEGEYIAAETLSRAMLRGEPPEGAHVGEFDIDGLKLKVGLVRL